MYFSLLNEGTRENYTPFGDDKCFKSVKVKTYKMLMLFFVSGGAVGIFVLDTVAAFVCRTLTRGLARQNSFSLQ
jgi:hypothetical protein